MGYREVIVENIAQTGNLRLVTLLSLLVKTISPESQLPLEEFLSIVSLFTP
jgi:hypothetical protein